MSDRAENLEAIENRLKHDILQEAMRCVSQLCHFVTNRSDRYGGLILTHNEMRKWPQWL